MRVRALAATAALALGAGLLTSPAPALADDQTAPRITTSRMGAEGGGLSPFAHAYCSIVVEFADASPSSEKDYALVLDGRQVARGAWARWDEYDDGTTWGEPGTFGISYTCGKAGTYSVVVREYAGKNIVSESAADSVTYRYIRGPAKAKMGPVRRKKKQPTVRAGEKITVKFGRRWEKGVVIESQAWTSKTRSFTSEDYMANTEGKAAVFSTKGKNAKRTFRVPKRLAGRWLWVSYVARKGDWGASGVMDREIIFGRPIKILPPSKK